MHQVPAFTKHPVFRHILLRTLLLRSFVKLFLYFISLRSFVGRTLFPRVFYFRIGLPYFRRFIPRCHSNYSQYHLMAHWTGQHRYWIGLPRDLKFFTTDCHSTSGSKIQTAAGLSSNYWNRVIHYSYISLRRYNKFNLSFFYVRECLVLIYFYNKWVVK